MPHLQISKSRNKWSSSYSCWVENFWFIRKLGASDIFKLLRKSYIDTYTYVYIHIYMYTYTYTQYIYVLFLSIIYVIDMLYKNFLGNEHSSNVSETWLFQAGFPCCRVWAAQCGPCHPWLAENGRTWKVDHNHCVSANRFNFYHQLKKIFSYEPATLSTTINGQWRETDIGEGGVPCSQTGVWLGWAKLPSGRACVRRKGMTSLIVCVS